MVSLETAISTCVSFYLMTDPNDNLLSLSKETKRALSAKAMIGPACAESNYFQRLEIKSIYCSCH